MSRVTWIRKDAGTEWERREGLEAVRGIVIGIGISIALFVSAGIAWAVIG